MFSDPEIQFVTKINDSFILREMKCPFCCKIITFCRAHAVAKHVGCCCDRTLQHWRACHLHIALRTSRLLPTIDPGVQYLNGRDCVRSGLAQSSLGPVELEGCSLRALGHEGVRGQRRGWKYVQFSPVHVCRNPYCPAGVRAPKGEKEAVDASQGRCALSTVPPWHLHGVSATCHPCATCSGQ